MNADAESFLSGQSSPEVVAGGREVNADAESFLSGQSEESDRVETDEEDEDDVELESLESWEGNEEDEDENEYFRLLQALSEKWLLVELCHTVSKAATNAFWELAISLIPSLLATKKGLNITRKIPQFVHVRRKLHKQFLPQVHHSTAYQQEGSEEIIRDHEIDAQNNSLSKIFETASVSVITITT